MKPTATIPSKSLLYAAVLCAAVIALLLSRCFLRPSDALRNGQLVPVVRGDLDIRVKTVGELDAARTHVVSSAIRGDKGKIIWLVEDGSMIAAGDVLVRLDPTPFESEMHRLGGEVRSLEAGVESARQMLEWDKNQSEREIQTAEYDLKVARLDHRRLVEGEGPLQMAQYKNELDKAKEEHDRYRAYIADLDQLTGQGFDNSAELDLARRKTQQLYELYQTASQRYESYKEHVLPASIETANARQEKAAVEIEQVKKGAAFKIARSAANLAEIEGKLETARASLEQALAELNKTTIRAPFGGIAILYETFRDGQKRKPRVGDLVWQNQPLLYLPDIATMIVKTRVREVDLHKVAIGQSCSVAVDAFPDHSFTGKVTALGMLAAQQFEGGGEKYFQLTVTLEGENSRLRPGMTARMEVKGEDAGDILYVPIHAVFSQGPESFCYLAREDGSFRIRKVTTGRQNEDLIEIVSGLKQGDLVSLLRPPRERIVSGNE